MRRTRRWRASRQVQHAAKALRARMTDAERVLWSALRRNQMGGLRFRRQHPIGPSILDLYSPAVRLGVELDGPIHDGRRERDQARTEALETLGIRVIRFRNEQVMNDLQDVVREIEYGIGRAQASE